MIKILFVAANPFFEHWDVEFDEELYVIRRTLKSASYRDRIDFIETVAVEFGELDSLLSLYQPDIVHLAVPALPDVGFYFQEIDQLEPRPTPDDAYADRIPTGAGAGSRGDAMIETFRPFASSLKCIVCNTPLSQRAAIETSRYAGNVIGWPAVVHPDKCFAFAEGFYSILGSGANLRLAFLAGSRRAQLKQVPFADAQPYRILDQYRELPDIDVSATSSRDRLQRPPLRALYLAAVPTHKRHGSTLNLAKEVRSIQEKFHRGPLRDESEFRVEWAVRVNDLQEHLLEHDPTVLIVGGHAGIEGVAMKGRDGKVTLATTDMLCGAIKVAGGNLKCVILNGCKTVETAKALAKQVGFAVGMADDIPDQVAIVFAEGFFRGIAYHKAASEAYQMGLQSIREVNYDGKADRWMQIPKFFNGLDSDGAR